MRKYLLLLASVIVLGKTQVHACTCIYIETFCETVNYYDTFFHDLIILGTVTETRRDGIEVAVVQRLFGKDSRTSIFIKSGNGADCGEFTSKFKRGQQMILALEKTYESRDAVDNQYFVSICGVSYLPVENGIVKGKIAPGIESLPYADFVKSSTCPIFEHFDPQTPVPFEFKVYPNPTRNRLFLEPAKDLEDFDYSLSDIRGRTVVEGTWKQAESDSPAAITLPGYQMEGGIYLLRIKSGSDSRTLKVMIAGE
jgi:hypothetical protein